jgi:hypothetical protein
VPVAGLIRATKGVSDPYGKFGRKRKGDAGGQVGPRFGPMVIKNWRLPLSPEVIGP